MLWDSSGEASRSVFHHYVEPGVFGVVFSPDCSISGSIVGIPQRSVFAGLSQLVAVRGLSREGVRVASQHLDFKWTLPLERRITSNGFERASRLVGTHSD